MLQPAVLSGDEVVVHASLVPTFQLDTRNSGSSWHVTLQVSDMVGSAGSLPAASLSYAAAGTIGNVVLQPSPIAGDPVHPVFGPKETTLSTATLDVPRACLSATHVPRSGGRSGSGEGLYAWTPDASRFRLTLPASAPAGVYTATMVVSLTVGP